MRWFRHHLWRRYAIFCQLAPLLPLHVVATTVAPGVTRLSPENWFIRLLGRIGGYPYAVAYLIDDEVLVDTCFGWAQKALVDYVNARGLAESIHTIVVTHEHEDHFGNAAILSRLTGAAVFAHPAAHGEISYPDEARWYRGFLFGPVDPAEVQVAPHSVSTSVRKLELVHTPGHTPGHLVAFDTRNGIMFAGDLFLEVELDAQLADADGPSWLASLDRVAALNVELLADGHGTVLSGPDAKNALAGKAAFLREMQASVAEHIAAGPTAIQAIARATADDGLVNSISYGEGRMSLLTGNDFSRSNLVRTFVHKLIADQANASPNSTT